MKKFYNILKNHQVSRRPDGFYFVSPAFGGGYTGWGVYLSQPEPYPVDVWGRPVSEDHVFLGLPQKSRVDVLSGDVPPVVRGTLRDLSKIKEWSEEDYSYLKSALGKEYDFLFLTKEEQDAVIGELENYYSLDADDGHGISLHYVFPLCKRNDSPDPEWNKKAGEEKTQAILRRIREQREELKSLPNDLVVETGVADDQLSISTPYGTFSIFAYKDLLRRLEDVKILRQKEEEIRRLISQVLSGERPVGRLFRPDGKPKCLYLQGDTLTVPRHLIGRVIGKGGANIRPLSNLVGRRIRVVGVDDAEYNGVKIETNYYELRDFSDIRRAAEKPLYDVEGNEIILKNDICLREQNI